MELLERATELGVLGSLLGRAAMGEGQLVFLGGEAGIGKTSLVQRAREAVPADAQVLVGSCDPLSTPRPLGPLLDIVHSADSPLGRLVATDAPRHQIFRAVLQALSAAPATLFVVEDAHWADEATLDLLRYLGRRVAETRSLVVVTYRDDEVGSAHPLRAVLADLATSSAVRRVQLAPLSGSAVRRLAGSSDVDPFELHRRTGGNPFFVTEVLAVGGRGIPATVRDVILQRVARLSTGARAALDAAAVIGTRVELWILAAVLDRRIDGVIEPVDECLAVGLLQANGEVLGFRHELARAAIQESMSPVRAAVLHGAVLRALRSRPSAAGDLARLAHHAEAAGDQEAVLAIAPEAARRAGVLGAHREAAAQYGRALRFAADLPDEQRASLLVEWLQESHHIGQLPDAIAAGDALLVIAHRAGDVVKEAEALSLRAWVLVTAGRNAEADQASRAALDLLSPIPPGPTHAYAYLIQAALRMLNRNGPEAITWGNQAIALAERLELPVICIRGLNVVGSVRVLSGDEAGGRADLEKSGDLARAAGLDSYVAQAYCNLGSSLGEIYRFSQAEKCLSEGIAFAGERDLDLWHWYMVAWLALVRLYQGRWSEAADLAESVLRMATASPISRIMALVALGRVRARRGDPEVAATLGEALALAAPTGTLQRVAPVRAARAEAAWLTGNREHAAAEARAALDLAIKHEHRWHIGELSFWLWRAGELASPGPEVTSPFARQIRGDWAGAAADWRQLGCPYEAARALVDSPAEADLREALATFERLGARPLIMATKRQLLSLGVRDIPRGPRPATRANPAGLTAREAEVLALIAAGDTNVDIAGRLFLSPKTVEHHVSGIFQKLGVNSRRQAIHVARERGALPPT